MSFARKILILIACFVLFTIGYNFTTTETDASTCEELPVERLSFGYHIDLSCLCDENQGALECPPRSIVNQFDYEFRLAMREPE